MNVGDNGASAWTRPTSPTDSSLTRSNTVQVTNTNYNDAGEVGSVEDPRGITSETFYDALGRTLKTIQDSSDSIATPIAQEIGRASCRERV